MKNLLNRVIDDLGCGENIDIYATVVVALAVAMLNLIGFNQQSLIDSVSLAVLALLASSMNGRANFDLLRIRVLSET